MSEAEQVLWAEMKDRLGCRYVRQKPIGPYFADFACRRHKVVVECDGSQHEDSVDQDAFRDRVMNDLGWTVLRFWTGEIYNETTMVITTIHRTCNGGEL